MRILILIRHADAAHTTAGTDFERPLTERGRQHGLDQGAWLAERQFAPDRVLCSPATRTLETAQSMGLAVTHPVKAIYEASPGELLRLLESHADAETIALIGHNPGISGVAGFLTARRLHLKPGTIVGIRFGTPVLGAPQPGSGEVRLFRHPADRA